MFFMDTYLVKSEKEKCEIINSLFLRDDAFRTSIILFVHKNGGTMLKYLMLYIKL
jgi:hypothetical protein